MVLALLITSTFVFIFAPPCVEALDGPKHVKVPKRGLMQTQAPPALSDRNDDPFGLYGEPIIPQTAGLANQERVRALLKRSDFIQIITDGTEIPLEKRYGLLLYLLSMNTWFQQESHWFDQRCVSLADPEFGRYGWLWLSKSLWGLVRDYNNDQSAASQTVKGIVDGIKNQMQVDPERLLFSAPFNTGILKEAAKQDAKIIASEGHCSAPWFEAFWENARKYVKNNLQ